MSLHNKLDPCGCSADSKATRWLRCNTRKWAVHDDWMLDSNILTSRLTSAGLLVNGGLLVSGQD
jgi:hypothetical protein